MTKFNPEEWVSENTNEQLLIHQLKQLLSETEKENEDLKNGIIKARKNLDLALAIQGTKKAPRIKPKSKKSREGTPVFLASDWHIEDLVTLESVGGLNEYNLEISKKSSENYFHAVHRLIDFYSKSHVVKDAILWLGGDMINGYIHIENIENNLLAPTQASLRVQDYISAGIDYILASTKLEKLHIPCNYGNHGRLTKRKRYSTGAHNNLEWLTYHSLAKKYAGEKRVQFYIPESTLLYFPVYDWTLRFHHGDDIKYYGGVSGLHPNLKKAHVAWNQSRYADLTILGHFHQYLDANFAFVNGSLKGYDTYALGNKLEFQQPLQAAFLIDKDRGKVLSTPILVRKRLN